MLRPSVAPCKICRQKSGKFTPPKASIQTSYPERKHRERGHGKTNPCASRCLKEELPRKADRIIKKEDDPTRYTVTRIVRKYGGKIEFVTDNDRRFRKISTSDYLFEVGDVLVAKRGVFESVFLINQDGKRIKVKIVN